ncbi:deleted in malignant brain tumors 1 protein-like isoform X2 [Lineus longissimus]|uniref:deleted in malignant brain tumors 1 protein-like isoform X2 n=1 Tax=Lineus longissimus TaxID=88925 RepID=UPI00315C7448
MDRLLPLLVLLLFKFVGGTDIVVVCFANSGATSGTVRVRVNGSPEKPSKTICWDSTWGMEEANVTCRQMGFLKATSTGNDSDKIDPIIFDVRCSGTETNLADCSYSLSGPCQSNQFVSVTCLRNPAFNGLFDVRLNGSTAHKGIVESRQTYQGNAKQPWYALCYNLWSKEDSEVVCRQLGYSGVKATTGIIGSLPNVSAGELKCTGTEQTLRGCGVIPTSECTDKTIYTQVECNLDSETQQPFDIRLTGGNTSAGSVELLKNGKWGVICDKDGEWKLASARVVCRQLGFVDAIRVTEPAEFGQGNGSIHLKNPGCKGDEWSIERCPRPYGWGGGVKACQTKDTAGVVCSPEKFPAYDISSTRYTPNTSKSFRRFFLHSQGFPQLFNYEAQTHHLCTMTSNTIIEFSIYIHYKKFQENHSETLSFQANDSQATSSTFNRLQLYGNNSDPGPYTTNTKSMTMEFKSNGATGSGKFRLEIRVPASIAVSLSCYNLTTTPTTTSSTSTTSTTSTTSVTSQGNPTDTTTALVSNTATGGSTKGEVTEPITTPVSMTTDQTDSTTSASVDGVVGGLVGAIVVAAIALILGVAL